jgi:UDP-glucose 4-epimerase
VHLPALEEGDMTRRKPDITKMKELLGSKPKISLEDGLKRVIDNHKMIR